MHRGIILEKATKLFNLYIHGQLTKENVENILDENIFIEIDNFHITTVETNFLYMLFRTVPYHAINQKLIDFLKQLQNISFEKTKYKSIIILIPPTIAELQFTIEERIKTEVYAHLALLLPTFALHKNINQKENLLLHTLSNPKQLVGKDILENETYEQMSLIQEQNQVDIREKISMQRCNITQKIIRNTQKNIFKALSLEEFYIFKNNLLELINNTPFPKELSLIYENELNEIEKYIVKRQKKENKEYPLLKLMTKKDSTI